ncbi:MAG TPA: FmdB family zinc ribbon protein [Actinomycetota bacterium]|nr:FmdB family zinc ribbon protein [Actinomycetota bacterium]
MPTYEYACKSCGQHVEVVQSFKDDPLKTCAVCGGPLRKVFGSIGIAFKGSGFYRNDSRPAASSSSDKSSSDQSSSDKGSSDKSSSDTGASDKSSSEKGASDKGAADKGSSSAPSSDKGGSKGDAKPATTSAS